MRMKIRTYSELKNIKTFEGRYSYLQLKGIVGNSTFGFDRYLNQALYQTGRWKRTRDIVIIRDDACDLGIPGYDIYDRILVHHMNPITIEDVELDKDYIYDPEFLICTTYNTHTAVHFGNEDSLPKPIIERSKNDTCPWKL
jgi:hypothetical protein